MAKRFNSMIYTFRKRLQPIAQITNVDSINSGWSTTEIYKSNKLF